MGRPAVLNLGNLVFSHEEEAGASHVHGGGCWQSIYWAPRLLEIGEPLPRHLTWNTNSVKHNYQMNRLLPSDMKYGIRNLPSKTLCLKIGRVGPSKGSAPQTRT